ncbi:MAG: antitoxin [Acidobacteriota bacterium]
MRDHYELSKMKARRNPYPQMLKQSVTVRLDRDTVDYFKGLSAKIGVTYQNLIKLFLRDCAERQKEPSLTWVAKSRRGKSRTTRASVGSTNRR